MSKTFLANEELYWKSLYTIGGIAERNGGKLLAPPEGFIVLDIQGPLKNGELERAADWAKRIMATQ